MASKPLSTSILKQLHNETITQDTTMIATAKQIKASHVDLPRNAEHAAPLQVHAQATFTVMFIKPTLDS